MPYAGHVKVRLRGSGNVMDDITVRRVSSRSFRSRSLEEERKR